MDKDTQLPAEVLEDIHAKADEFVKHYCYEHEKAIGRFSFEKCATEYATKLHQEQQDKRFLETIKEELSKENAALQAQCDRYEKALKRIQSMDGENSNYLIELMQEAANEALSVEGEKPKMQYNTCKTCGACNGRAGLLINDECHNCYDTRQSGAVTIHTSLERTPEEIDKTMAILAIKDTNNG